MRTFSTKLDKSLESKVQKKTNEPTNHLIENVHIYSMLWRKYFEIFVPSLPNFTKPIFYILDLAFLSVVAISNNVSSLDVCRHENEQLSVRRTSSLKGCRYFPGLHLALNIEHSSAPSAFLLPSARKSTPYLDFFCYYNQSTARIRTACSISRRASQCGTDARQANSDYSRALSGGFRRPGAFSDDGNGEGER